MFAGRGLKRIWRWDIHYEGRKVGHLFCAKRLKTPPCRPKTTLGTKSPQSRSRVEVKGRQAARPAREREVRVHSWRWKRGEGQGRSADPGSRGHIPDAIRWKTRATRVLVALQTSVRSCVGCPEDIRLRAFCS